MKINFYGSELNLNETNLEITGKTFPVKDNLKKYWGCTFNSENKSWVLPEKNKVEFVNKFAVAQTNVEVKSTVVKNRVCPKCGTYCYGDCEAN